MKNLAIVAALGIAVSAPAYAQSQLELSLGVEAGKYTLNQLADLKKRETESGNDGRTYFQEIPLDVSSQKYSNNTALPPFVRFHDGGDSDN